MSALGPILEAFALGVGNSGADPTDFILFLECTSGMVFIMVCGSIGGGEIDTDPTNLCAMVG